MRERLRLSQLPPQPQHQLHYVDPELHHLQPPTKTKTTTIPSGHHPNQQDPLHHPMSLSQHQQLTQQSQHSIQGHSHQAGDGIMRATPDSGNLSGLYPLSSAENGSYHSAGRMITQVDDADIAAGNRTQPTNVLNMMKNQQQQHKRQHPHKQPQQLQQQHQHESRALTKAQKTAEAMEGAALAGGQTPHNTKYYLPLSGPGLPPRSATLSFASVNQSITSHGVYPSDLEFFEDLVSEPVLVLGVDISHLDRNSQFLVCATGVFGFSLLYGYLQELISVQICSRQLGLFLAMVQFSGYTILAFLLRNFVYAKEQRRLKNKQKNRRFDKQNRTHNKKDDDGGAGADGAAAAAHLKALTLERGSDPHGTTGPVSLISSSISVPIILYLGLAVLRAIDLGMTNLAMQYINYPAKTLMKSSRVVFTMLFGVVISRKRYKLVDYVIVLAMVAGLALFMHADASSSAVFDLAGVLMLTVSLLCDGAISNVSETIMSKFGVGQDEFIFNVYSIALVAITAAAALKGDMIKGFIWLLQPGTYDELSKPVEERTWTVTGKITVVILFSSMGFFGSSCSAAITKNFGALTMSITSTARKAATLFLSFFLFNNVCTIEHILGVVIFIAALTAKSLRRNKSKSEKKHNKAQPQRKRPPEIRRQLSADGSTASSLFSDISDLEIPPSSLGSVGGNTIPAVVTTDTLRSRPAASPKNNRSLVTTV